MTYVAFSLASVLCGPLFSDNSSRTADPHESFQVWRVQSWLLIVSDAVDVGVALRPRTLVHSLMASSWLL